MDLLDLVHTLAAVCLEDYFAAAGSATMAIDDNGTTSVYWRALDILSVWIGLPTSLDPGDWTG